MQNLPRIMIAGTHSGVGKTTIAMALMSMLYKKGLRVQPYKVGPDYIDPGFHQTATGRVSKNLDTFLLGEQGALEIFARSAGDADISVIEGVMGLYDGVGVGDEGSSARVAHILQCPVILVLDVRSMASSAAAVVWGYANLPGGIPLAGVILNRVGSAYHLKILTEAIEEKTGIPVLGGIMREHDLQMPERHLGLVPSVESKKLNEILEMLTERVVQGVDVEKIIHLAHSAPYLKANRNIFAIESGEPVRLGIVKDSAFNFYYQDGLDLLTAMGAELVYCSALDDESLPPQLDGIYIGGGFPEMFIEQLANNHTFMSDLRHRVTEGLPIFAECGGLMYLCRTIKDFAGREFNGVGIIPAHCQMQKKLVALGYARAKAMRDNILVNEGAELRGHEFHYSCISGSDLSPGFYLRKLEGDNGHVDGHAYKNILATYLHVHFAGLPDAARGFLKSCALYRQDNGGRK